MATTNELLIDALVDMNEFDLSKVAVKLAKTDPVKFLELSCGDVSWEQHIIETINADRERNPRSGSKVIAIKAMRQISGLGLRDAKLEYEKMLPRIECQLIPTVE